MNELEQQFETKAIAKTSVTELAMTRAEKEVQGRLVLAKKFPRDQVQCRADIMENCKRKELAEKALYAYPKGGKTVTGPSIRLAECIAQNWGNFQFGVVELSSTAGESEVQSYAWDLQKNTYEEKVFTVKHQRKARGEIHNLEDPREVYEMNANQGARRLRACILGIIPGDVVDKAVAACIRTLAGKSSEPISDRALAIVTAFSDLGVSQSMIEGNLGHTLETIAEIELVNLRSIYTSLNDNFAKVEDYFKQGDVTVIDSPNQEKPKTRKTRSDKGKKKGEAETPPIEVATAPVNPTEPPTTPEPKEEPPSESSAETLHYLLADKEIPDSALLDWLRDSGQLTQAGVISLDQLGEERCKGMVTQFDKVLSSIELNTKEN